MNHPERFKIFQIFIKFETIRDKAHRVITLFLSFSLKQTLNTLQGNRLYLEPTILKERSSTIFGQRRGEEGEERIYRGILYRERWKGWARLAVSAQHSISTRVTKMGITNGTSYKSGAQQLCVNHRGINVLSKHHTLDSLISEMHPLFRHALGS